MLTPLSNWHSPTKRRAQAMRAIQERDEEALLQLLETYLMLKSRKRAAISPQTLRKYRQGVRDFMAWAWPSNSVAPQLHLHKVTSDDLDRWISDLQVNGGHLGKKSKPLKPMSIATYLAAVRSFYRALSWAEAAELPEVIAPRDPTPAHERRPALPLELYKQLLKYLEGDSAAHQRDRLAARLMGEAGLRISEAVHLRVEDVLLAERLLEIKHGKGGKARSVPVSKGLAAEISNWLKVRIAYALSGESRVLVNLGGRKAHGQGMSERGLRGLFNNHYATLGFSSRYYGVHMLRHTAGTRFYKASRDLHATARLLGHSNINTSAIYAKMDLEGLFEVVDKLED